MALDPSDTYGAQVDTSDPTGYPLGKARNITVPGDGTGTPLEKAWVNDIWGLQQALLDEAGITPSGTPDKVGASQYVEALNYLYQREAVWGFFTLEPTLKTSGTPFVLTKVGGSTGVTLVGTTGIQLPRTGTYLVSGVFNVEPASGSDGDRINAYWSGSEGSTYYFSGYKTGTYARLSGTWPFFVTNTASVWNIRPLSITQTPESASPSNQMVINQIVVQRIGD